MALNFKKAAVNAGVVSCTVATLPKAPQEVIDDMMGKVVTINQVGITKSKKSSYAIFTCEEYPDVYFHAGERFNLLVEAWMKEILDQPEYELTPGDCETLNDEIAQQGGVKLTFIKVANKTDSSKNPYWDFRFV